MKRMIYADNAATTKLDMDSFEAMKPFLLNEYGNASQPYSFSRLPKKALQEARQVIASCINAEPEEIFFTSGGTESDNWAIAGTVLASRDKCSIVTSAFEHHAILRICEAMTKQGCTVKYANPSKEGVVNADALMDVIPHAPQLVSIMMSNNEIGTIQPITELAAVAHQHGALFHTDAVQSVGHIPVDVKALGVDMLSASAHKFNGPKGVGFLYIKRGTPIVPYIYGGAQEGSLRAGTENIASIVGMAVALKKNCDKMEEYTHHVFSLEKELLEALDTFGIQYVRNGKGETVPGNISLSFPGFEGEALLHRLDLMGIQVSTGSACDSVNAQISHVLRAIRLDEKLATGTVRISLGKDNTIDDVRNIAQAIKKITI